MTGSEDTVGELGEFGLIERLTTGLVQPPTTLLGPGDDAALLAAPDRRVVATTDVLVAGVHFRLDWSSPEQVGRKAVAANVADVAAMGAVPTALLVGLACPPSTPAAVVDGLVAGMWAEAGPLGAGVVGGDVVSAQQLVLSVTALGDLRGRAPVTRAGARPGHVVAVAGRLGWAAAGLAVLGGFRFPPAALGEAIGVAGSAAVDPAVDAVVDAHRVPEPPYAAGPQAADAGATAMIDTSDGLLADLGHLAAASGVAIDVCRAALPVPQQLADVAGALGADPLRWVLTGGEDHALAACFPTAAAVTGGWRVIGEVGAGSGVTVDGEPYPDDPDGGWRHWR